jgi:outer membrane protein
MKKMFLMAAFVVVGGIVVQAQEKYGHLNFGNIVSLMPDTKASDGLLQAYQDSLVQAGEQQIKNFEAKAQTYMTKVQNGELAPVEQEKQGQALQQEQAALQQLDRYIQQQMSIRREQLLAPIVKEVEDAIEAYAKENGYMMIFDTSVFNSVLYAQESDDLFEAIKAKLGL